MSTPDVVLSCCHDNAKEVARLYDDLIQAGLTVWWDQQMRPGEDWKLAIRTAMKNSSAVVLCLSADRELQRKRLPPPLPWLEQRYLD